MPTTLSRADFSLRLGVGGTGVNLRTGGDSNSFCDRTSDAVARAAGDSRIGVLCQDCRAICSMASLLQGRRVAGRGRPPEVAARRLALK
jgi:hypothetical protein